MNLRTDLASELRDEALKDYAAENKGKPDGIIEKTYSLDEGISVCEIEITTKAGAELIGKPIGKYITLSFSSATDMDYNTLSSLADATKAQIEKLLSNISPTPESAIFCGLGNRLLSADSIGPLASDGIVVTHHIKKSSPELYRKSGLFDVICVAPGVTAQTGVEAFEIISGIVKSEKPDVLIVCDALAARETARLSNTIQISSCGISPGSGVGGCHDELSEQTLGIPVISIGVPTVVETQTLIYDALSSVGADKNVIAAATEKAKGLFVSPNDIDVVSKKLSSVISCAVNAVFQKEISYEEMLLL